MTFFKRHLKILKLLESIDMNSKNRFAASTSSEIDKEISENKPKNTVKSHKYVWKQFMDFCNERNYSFDKNSTDDHLANLLKDWAYNMRKIDGSVYKESTVKTIWNNTAKLLQNKYYSEYQRIIDPFSGVVFKTARDARNTIRRHLQAIPEARKQSSASLSAEDLNRILKQFDEDTPDGLQKMFYHIAAVELAWRGGEAANCKLDYFKEEINNNGSFSGRIEYNSIFSKTSQGGDKRLAESKYLTRNQENLQFCPVRLFRKLISKRTANIKTDRFFLTVNNAWKNDSTWFKNMPIGINKISKWTKSSAERAGLNTKLIKITNHSNRSTAVSQLANAGVSEQQIIKITGHNSTHSIKPYLHMSTDRHLEVISHLRKSNVPSASLGSPHVNIQQGDQPQEVTNKNNSVNNYNNCVFNINYYEHKPESRGENLS